MKPILFAAAALAATCTAAPAFAQQSYVLLTTSNNGAVMVSTGVTGPQTDRRVQVITVVNGATESGADNFQAEFASNCSTHQYRYVQVYGYKGDEQLGGGPGDPQWESTETGTLNDAVINYSCTGKRSINDGAVLRGESAARAYGRSKF